MTFEAKGVLLQAKAELDKVDYTNFRNPGTPRGESQNLGKK